MAIRIRHQRFLPGQKRATVTIIGVDQFTRRARKLDPTKTEREHLLEVLRHIVSDEHEHDDGGGNFCPACPYKIQGPVPGFSHLFWIEKP